MLLLSLLYSKVIFEPKGYIRRAGLRPTNIYVKPSILGVQEGAI